MRNARERCVSEGRVRPHRGEQGGTWKGKCDGTGGYRHITLRFCLMLRYAQCCVTQKFERGERSRAMRLDFRASGRGEVSSRAMHTAREICLDLAELRVLADMEDAQIAAVKKFVMKWNSLIFSDIETGEWPHPIVTMVRSRCTSAHAAALAAAHTFELCCLACPRPCAALAAPRLLRRACCTLAAHSLRPH